MRTRTAVLPLALLALAVPVAASATPTDDAELSQTIEVAWLMPGPFHGYATFPQTYLPDGVPECGDGAVQVDVYKYGTAEVQALVDALLAGGVLTGPEADARVSAGREHYFVELEPCETDTEPGGGTDNPGTDVGTGGGTVQPPATDVLSGGGSVAPPATAVIAAPVFTG